MIDIYERISRTFNNTIYLDNLLTSDKNWLGIKTQDVLSGIRSFFKSL